MITVSTQLRGQGMTEMLTQVQTDIAESYLHAWSYSQMPQNRTCRKVGHVDVALMTNQNMAERLPQSVMSTDGVA